MNNLSFSSIASFVNGKLLGKDGELTNVVIDSRKVKQNDFFVALKGEVYDAHDFIEEAIKNGASCLLINENTKLNLSSNLNSSTSNINVLTSNPNVSFILVKDTLVALGQLAKLHKSKFTSKIIAITGSSGKTTTRNMIANIFNEIGNVLSPKKNFNNEVGLPLTLLELNNQHDFAILEMGATKKNDIKYLMEIISPDVTLVTNIGPAHLETMKNIDGVASVKSEAYEYLSINGTAIINLDDKYSGYMLKKLKGQKIITYSMSNKTLETKFKPDVTIENIIKNSTSTKFTLITNIGKIEIHMNVVGLHNIMNALASAACARSYGASLEQIKSGLEKFKPVASRFSIHSGINGAKIIDDCYNANPVSVKAAINILKDMSSKKKIFIFADMLELGDNAEQIHEQIGKLAQESGINQLFGFGDLAKFSCLAYGKSAKHFSDKSFLVDELKKFLDKDTTVLIKGSRGMKMEEIVHKLVL